MTIDDTAEIIKHFSGYPALLIVLDVVKRRVLKAAIVEAWQVCARG